MKSLGEMVGAEEMAHGAKRMDRRHPAYKPMARLSREERFAHHMGLHAVVTDPTVAVDQTRLRRLADHMRAQYGESAAQHHLFGIEQEMADLSSMWQREGRNVREMMRQAHWRRMQQQGG